MSKDNLKRLKGADRVRTQVNVDLGSNDIQGVQQGLFEIVSNSIDRFRRGYGNYIKVIKNKDLSYEVRDYADGLPMDWNQDEQAYNWELATRVPWAGGNYDHDSESLGQHGKGLSSTLLSSKNVKVISYKNGYRYEINMLEGRPLHKETLEFICDDVDELFSKEDGMKILKKEENIDNKKGTHIIWTPDDTLFTNIDIPIEWICEKLRKQAIVNSGLTIDIIDYTEEKEYRYLYENGILDYIKELNKDKGFTDIIHFSDKGRGKDAENKPEYDYRYEFALIFNNEVNKAEYYHNSSELLHGGSTAKAIEKALVDVIHNYCTENNLYNKNEKKVRYSDVEDSLLCVISSFSNRTSFTNQTKLAITNEFIRDFTAKTLTEKLTVYFIENKSEALKICNQILINKRSSEKAEKSRLNLKKKLSEEITVFNKIPNLIECKSKNKEENILCICEGKSALGSLISARGDNHALLPLRGKVRNCKKSTLEQILNDQIICDIIRAMGCGISIKSKANKEFLSFDKSKMRYGKIYIIVDADVDGMGSILPLLLTMFDTLTPELIEDGYIYLCETPKYEVLCEDKYYYATNNDELEEIEKKLEGKKYKVFYIKGLAELNADTMAMCLEPGYKNVTQIRVDDILEARKSLELHMGSNVKDRKDYIMNNFDKVGGYYEN